jgi:hypothetical protein
MMMGTLGVSPSFNNGRLMVRGSHFWEQLFRFFRLLVLAQPSTAAVAQNEDSSFVRVGKTSKAAPS